MSVLSRSQKYIVECDLAYTEDHVLIYNLYVTQIPTKTPQSVLVKFFEKFGKLKKITFYARKKLCTRNSYPNEIYVNYEKAASATNVLTSAPHHIHARRLKIIPCDSWKQPSIAMIQNKEKRKKLPQLKEQEQFFKSFNTLDDDCLLHIFKYVPIPKQAVLAQTSTRFQNVFHTYIRTAHKKLDLRILNALTAFERHEFFKCAGPWIRHIHAAGIKYICGRTLEFIAEYCTRLKELYVTDCNCRCSDLRLLLIKRTSLTNLTLKSCVLKPSTFTKMRYLKKLKELNINNNSLIEGQYISEATNVTKLNLCDCSFIKTRYFDDIFGNMTDLIVLDIRGCILNDQNFLSLSENCKNVEILKITGNIVCKYECLSNLPKLRSLDIHYPNYTPMGLRTELLVELVSKKIKLENLSITMCAHIDAQKAELISKITTLKRFSLFFVSSIDIECYKFISEMKNLEYLTLNRIDNICNDILFNIVSRLPHLKELDIQSCININDRFVNDITEFLIQNRQFNNHILIHAYETSLRNKLEIQKTPYALRCEKFVELNMEINYSPSLLGDFPSGLLHERIELEVKPLI